MKYFITGNSSGLGLGLTRQYLEAGAEVYGISRRGCDESHEKLFDQQCDLLNLDAIPGCLETLLDNVSKLDGVILNAAILGRIEYMVDTDMDEISRIMKINVWSNKVILDWLNRSSIEIDQIVLISSGAAVNGGKGWSGYSLSKATLNMLTQLYAHEFPSSHLLSLAPGLIDTAMQDHISDPDSFDIETFPGFQRLRDAKGTSLMPSADRVAERIISLMPSFKKFDSGSFVDIRDL